MWKGLGLTAFAPMVPARSGMFTARRRLGLAGEGLAAAVEETALPCPGGRRPNVWPVSLPAAADVAALVRLPAVLSVPGDVLLGAAASGNRLRPRTVALAGSSGLLYLAGMALNDWADREVDARERPQRPIPSGRVTPAFALGLAAGLTAAGVAGSAWAGGCSSLAVSLPLAGAVWAYDLRLKSTAAGPAAMAACRALDVLVGAGGGRLGPALPAAGVVGAHTLMLTMVSRHEVDGAGPGVARRALATTAVVAGAAGALAWSRGRGRPSGPRSQAARLGAAAALLGAYTASLVKAEVAAVRDPSPAHLQRVVGTGVLGLMPLEAGMVAAAGPAPAALAVAGAWPLARRMARKRSVT
jgi:4-hydroxybenzoate polyprenyltransferase